MITKLAVVTIHVGNQDEALDFYTRKLGFHKRVDVFVAPGCRWLTVSPTKHSDVQIFLKDPTGWYDNEAEVQMKSGTIGQASTWVFHTDNCHKTYETLAARGVKFISEPKDEIHGIEAVFEDLYGNTFSLLEQRKFS
jgi:predicted enzyme related to lactoylglutathione lyase